MPTVRANGISINHVIDGPEDGPWITFSNSLGTNVTMWDEQAKIAADAGWRVLRYDQRGHGGTEAAPPPYTFDLVIADVIALWDALGVKKSVFCGLSMGGSTGIGLAIEHPDRLTALIACDCRCDSPPGFAALWDDRIRMAEELGMPGMADPTVARWFNPDFLKAHDKDVIEKVRGMIRTTSLNGWIGCSRALQHIEYRDRLGEISIPVQFITGAQDPAANPEYAGPMVAAIPGAKMAILEPSGHISNMENPKQFNAAFTAFLSSL
jgi:3-oxoadipate enol-lactonase